MTRQRSFKRIVRARMEKTGESYTAARAALLTAEPAEIEAKERPPLATSDAAIRERTGRGGGGGWGRPPAPPRAPPPPRPHREIARHIAGLLEVHPLAWNAQAVAGSYERARGLREVGERADGFAITASKTVAVPVDVLFDAFVDERQRNRWLPDAELRERTATKPKSARFDWGEGETRVHVTFTDKGALRATATVSHERLPDAAEAERMKTFWRSRVATLKEVLEA
jgi:uncharacterized protein YndB with AHSA1/START domain